MLNKKKGEYSKMAINRGEVKPEVASDVKMTAAKIGEVTSEMTGDIKMTEDMKVSLKVGYLEKSKEVSFKPSQDLKIGDMVKITFQKV